MVSSGTANGQPARTWSIRPEGFSPPQAGATKNTVATVARKQRTLMRGSKFGGSWSVVPGSAGGTGTASTGVSLMLQRFAELLREALELRTQVGVEHAYVGDDLEG